MYFIGILFDVVWFVVNELQLLKWLNEIYVKVRH